MKPMGNFNPPPRVQPSNQNQNENMVKDTVSTMRTNPLATNKPLRFAASASPSSSSYPSLLLLFIFLFPCFQKRRLVSQFITPFSPSWDAQTPNQVHLLRPSTSRFTTLLPTTSSSISNSFMDQAQPCPSYPEISSIDSPKSWGSAQIQVRLSQFRT